MRAPSVRNELEQIALASEAALRDAAPEPMRSRVPPWWILLQYLPTFLSELRRQGFEVVPIRRPGG